MDLVRYRCGLGSRGMLTLLVCRYRSDGCIHRGRCLGTFAAWPKGNMGAARGLRLVAFLTDAIGDVLQVQDTGPGDLYTWHRNASFAHLTHRPV